MRAGAQLLLMAADPLNRQILLTMLDHPLETAPGRLLRVSSGGREALFVGSVVEEWLRRSPQGELDYDTPAGKAAVAALAQAWSATVVHMLAREPMSFGELHRAVEGVSRRALKRQLATMESFEQVVAFPGPSGQPLYMLTDWLRAGIAPLIASARLERRNPMEGFAPIDALDVEAGFRLSLPLIELPKELTGSFWLGLNLREEDDDRPADEEPKPGLTGVTARIDQGEIVSCEAGLAGEADAWAAGSANEWLDTVIEPDAKLVRTGGDRWLTGAVVRALHKTLFGPLGKEPLF
jgi:DNA-binding HxlR family transcriptional regulator